MSASRVRRTVAGVLSVGVAGAGLLAAGAATLDALFPPPLDRLHDLSVTVTDRSGDPLRVFLNRSGAWRLPAGAEAVDPLFLGLLTAYEDRRFSQHPGVDPAAMARAAVQNLAAGRVVSGASTLSMQVARLLEPRPRTFSAKLVETARALQLEWRYGKPGVLGMYLTLAPYGGNVEGIRAASLTLFGKPPRELTVGEAALLVALPQAPSLLRPDRAAERARAARDKVLDRAVAAGVLAPRAAEEAKTEPVPSARLALPSSAPHLARTVKARHPAETVVATTLDGYLQRGLEDLARRERETLHERAGLAILVIDNRTRAVLAYVGSPDALDERRQGPIDMVRAVRSPGSALKPFIYGLGFDDGVIHPLTQVADVSTRFGDYAPRNFDRGFSGELTIREALQRSLNVPAVLVLDRVGPVRFADALRRAGARLVLPAGASQPGLPVALGGASISLWDMAGLYAGLARGGLTAPLRVEPDAPAGIESRLLSAAAAQQVRAILEGTAPPAGVVQDPAFQSASPIALKTGTSYGFRDAWAFGVTERYTVGVWVGRPDGTPSPDRFGRNTAAPLLYRVFDRLPRDRGRPAGPLAADATPPALLGRLSAGEAAGQPVAAARGLDKPRLVFPSDRMVLEALALDGTEPLKLSASGGRRPLSWLVNGRRVAISPIRRDAEWRPDGPGTVRITVVDADGRSDSATVEIR
ncbi:penicillin-binding protein 1C [Azospirillum sp. SYSU D00513]|uniref:penicillin-binding protein 1C n=1 Tax=Azospirillum sp. SYSU D00513 TaxID=2812561 RepID=UPI001A96F2AF|nr:penicillin-binding protein 1C [Azospirillum sp. SYSU D00513]